MREISEIFNIKSKYTPDEIRHMEKENTELKMIPFPFVMLGNFNGFVYSTKIGQYLISTIDLNTVYTTKTSKEGKIFKGLRYGLEKILWNNINYHKHK